MLQKVPIVIQQNIPFAVMTEHLETIAALGGTASGHLLAFQTFSLVVEKVGDATATSPTPPGAGWPEPSRGTGGCRPHGVMAGTMTNPQARWLQQEIKRSGGESRVVLR